MNQLNFCGSTLDDAVKNLKKINSSAEPDTIISIDQEPFSGKLFVCGQPENVVLIASDLQVSDTSCVRFFPAENAEPGFVLSFLNEAGTIMGGSFEKRSFPVTVKGKSIFAADYTRPGIVLRKGEQLRKTALCFPQNWLMAQLSDTKQNKLRHALAVAENDSLPVITTSTAADLRITADIHKRVFRREWDRIFLGASVMALLESVIEGILNEQQLPRERKPHFYDEMCEVEKRLLTEPWDISPDIKSMAKDFCLSESTLKRRFRIVFGRPVYDYYLLKKMEAAKLLLCNSSLTVAQVAYKMGYEKASPFIATFKRYHHFSPGHFRKKEED